MSTTNGTLAVYDGFAYGHGETGPFGTQTGEIDSVPVFSQFGALAAGANACTFIREFAGVRESDVSIRWIEGEAETHEGVPVPVGAALITIDEDSGVGMCFGIWTPEKTV